MTYNCIEYDLLNGGVAQIALNRPMILNALSSEMVNELRDAVTIAATSGARVLLITGRGRAFCSGADLRGSAFSATGMQSGYGASVANALDHEFNPLIRELYALDIPIVSAVNGVAAGGGVGLALVADVCVAAHSASFVQVFGPRLGIVPDAGVSWFMARLLGRAKALGVAMLGETVSAKEAAELGLIWSAVADDSLQEEALTIANRFATGPTRAFRSIRRITDAAMLHPLESHLDLERDYQRVLCDTRDTVEAIAAFREKRTPSFTGS